MVALPLLALLLVWTLVRVLDPGIDVFRAFLRACVLVGVWLVLTTEALSLAGLVTPGAVALAWGMPVLGILGWLILRRDRFVGQDGARVADTRGEWSLVVALGAIFAVTALVAWLAPPQTWDSLNYHMPRVAHWAQLKAVRPFATGIEVQNSRTPLAEFGMLHAYVLAEGDRWVNFVEWLAMVGSVVGVGAVANQLGLRRPAALLAMVYAATIPMGIVQASSTMTDYVVTLYLVASASEILGIRTEGKSSPAYVFAGAAAGLAFLAKPTSVPYLLSLLGLGVWILSKQKPTRLPAAGVVAGLGLFLVLNVGHWARNVEVYGDPFTGGNQATVHLNQVLDPRGLVSNVARNIGLQIGTPSPHVNKAIALAAQELHDLLGLDPNDIRTTAHGRFKIDEPTTNENKSGNLVHLLVVSAALIYLILRRRNLDWRLLPMVLATLVGFGLFGWIFKWQIFGSRYHLPAFVLLAPAAGAALASGFSAKGRILSGWMLCLSGLPWLVGIASRPLLVLPQEANTGSVLWTPRSRLLLANGPYLARPYQEMTQRIRDASCTEVGIAVSGNGAEYPLWVFLGAPRSDVHIEWLVAGTPSAKYRSENFEPCAVICEGCEDRLEFSGLPLEWDGLGFRLYLESEEAE